jgi:hypothetical protein
MRSRRGAASPLVELLLRGLARLGDVAQGAAQNDGEVGQIHVASDG